MTPADAELAAALCLVVLSALGFWDGIVVHLFRERLPFRDGSRLEHGIHTLRAVLYPLILIAFFMSRSSLVAGLLLIGLDQIAEVWDMAIERQSRSYSGGLRSSEYVLHGAMISLRAAGIAFALSARSSAPTFLAPLSVAGVAKILLPGAVLVAMLHVALLLLPACRAWFAMSKAR